METGKITIAVAIITVVGALGTAAITTWGKTTSTIEPRHTQGSKFEPDVKLLSKISELEQVRDELKRAKENNNHQSILLDKQNNELEKLKYPFHKITNSKLKQLMFFHNDAACYGWSLNFTHEPDESFSHCVKKEILAKRFLKFFEELEIIENNGSMDYSRAKAKDELIKLQLQYQFTNPGWYTELMLGILIIEYAKRA